MKLQTVLEKDSCTYMSYGLKENYSSDKTLIKTSMVLIVLLKRLFILNLETKINKSC